MNLTYCGEKEAAVNATKRRIGTRAAALCLATVLLTGCAPLLARQYSRAEPHSSKFWESEAAGTLRAETYQDIVNDLLLVIGQHRENATLRIYNEDDDLTAAETLARAVAEVQNETPLGSFAVSYLTYTRQTQRGYSEAQFQIAYRRTEEQLQAVVNATSTEALYGLLQSALDLRRTELAVRIGYWDSGGFAQVEDAVNRVREDRGLTDTPPWEVSCYPEEGDVGLVEFRMDAAETDGTEAEEPDDETPTGDAHPADGDGGIPAEAESDGEGLA